MAQDLIGPNTAAGILGVGGARLRQLDHVLQPYRVDRGFRVYERARVEELARQRAAKKSK